jgi:hypothetical protein
MYDREAAEIFDLLDDGREEEARALFMEHLVGRCRDIDQAVSECFDHERYDDEHLWKVFALAYRQGWFGGKN